MTKAKPQGGLGGLWWVGCAQKVQAGGPGGDPLLLARDVVIPGASARAPMTVVVVGCFQGSAMKAQSAALQRQELHCVLPMGKADGGQTSRSTVKSELKSLFPSHSLRGTPRGPGTSLTGVRGLQEGCPPGAQLLS